MADSDQTRITSWDRAIVGQELDLGGENDGPCLAVYGDPVRSTIGCSRGSAHGVQHVATSGGVVVATWPV